MIFSVIVGQIDSPGMIFAVIPVVIVPVVTVVNADLNAAFLRYGSCHDCNRCGEGSSQEQRTDVAVRMAHNRILRMYSLNFVVERREVNGNLMRLRVVVPCVPIQLFVGLMVEVTEARVCALTHILRS
jgi:hypothetical protein